MVEPFRALAGGQWGVSLLLRFSDGVHGFWELICTCTPLKGTMQNEAASGWTVEDFALHELQVVYLYSFSSKGIPICTSSHCLEPHHPVYVDRQILNTIDHFLIE